MVVEDEEIFRTVLTYAYGEASWSLELPLCA